MTVRTKIKAFTLNGGPSYFLQLGLLLLATFMPIRASADACESVTNLKSENATINSAQTVAKGAFILPPETGSPSADFFTAFQTLQAFCRVRGTIRPSSDSHIEFEVWLPASGWNGKYYGAGNGGFGGSINYYRLAEAVNTGYAGSSTDTGHKGTPGDSSWALGHPERIIDFDYRAIHETAEAAKVIMRVFYGKNPTRSYFSSCSNGGRQGLMEAQRYPADFDGILAGAPWRPGILSSEPRIQNADGVKAFELNPTDSDFKPFKDRGGKLILYHGGNDAPTSTVKYYKNLVAKMGEQETREFVRLYVVPEMGHCEGGPEPSDFGQRLTPLTDPQHSISMALERWVETGIAPKEIIAAKYNADGAYTSGIVRTRPICPYPQVAEWSGKGSTDTAANYACKVPRKK